MDFEGIDMLDLFAGTGGIGIECVSRGARSVTAVEIAHVQPAANNSVSAI